MNKFFRIALQTAQAHDYSDMEYNLCAIIVRGGSIISTGFNKRGTNSFVEHYGDKARGQRDWCLNTHAEMDAVLQARQKSDLTGCKIYVIRKRIDANKGILAMSRPCCVCEGILKAYGIKKAYYTIDDNYYGMMRVGAGKGKDKIYACQVQDQSL